MIDYLTFIDELKDIKKSLGVNTDNKTMKEIDKTISKYESRISDFESANAPKDEDTTSSDVELSTVSNQIA